MCGVPGQQHSAPVHRLGHHGMKAIRGLPYDCRLVAPYPWREEPPNALFGNHVLTCLARLHLKLKTVIVAEPADQSCWPVLVTDLTRYIRQSRRLAVMKLQINDQPLLVETQIGKRNSN